MIDFEKLRVSLAPAMLKIEARIAELNPPDAVSLEVQDVPCGEIAAVPASPLAAYADAQAHPGNGEYFGGLEESQPAEPEIPLSILTFEEISLIPINESDCILGEHLLDKGSPLVIAGQGGTGKSRLIFQMLAAFKAGHEKFLNFDIHPGARNMRWLVLQTENSVRRLQDEYRRLKRWIEPEAWEAFNRDTLILTPINDQDMMINLNDRANIARIENALLRVEFQGIISDPLGDMATGDLNKDHDMRQTIQALGKISRTGNIRRALVVLHHALTGQSAIAKSTGYDRTSFARNSKVLFNWTRAQINVAPMNEDNSDQLAVSCAKCSDGKEFPAFAIKLNLETMIYECDSSVDVKAWAEDLKGSARPKPVISDEEIHDLCSPASSKLELAKKITIQVGCDRTAAYRYIRKAIDRKVIRESDEKLFRI